MKAIIMAGGVEAYPVNVLIDTTTVCNARCPFCPLFQGDSQMDREVRPATIMSDVLYERLFAEMAGWKKRPAVINQSVNSEPLQDPKFINRMAVLKKYDFGRAMRLVTNGTFLHESNAMAILDAGVAEIIVGFDGATKATYEQHRVKCNFDKVLENIERFANLRNAHRHKTKITIKYVRTPSNEHEVQTAWEMFATFLDPDLDAFEDSLAIDWGDKSAENIKFYYYLQKKVERKRLDRQIGCVSVDQTLVVHPDGIVGACCWDYNREVSGGGFASMGERDLLSIWRGNKRLGLITALKSGTGMPSKCKSCVTYYEYDDVPEHLERVGRDYLIYRYATGFVYRFPNKGATELVWQQVSKWREAHDFQLKQAQNWQREYEFQLQQATNWRTAYEELAASRGKL